MNPLFVLLAGPNGSGKSTMANSPQFLELGVEMINPDVIAKMAPTDANALIWSGREVRRRI